MLSFNYTDFIDTSILKPFQKYIFCMRGRKTEIEMKTETDPKCCFILQMSATSGDGQLNQEP